MQFDYSLAPPPGLKGQRVAPFLRRFHSRIRKTDGCWIWEGGVNSLTSRYGVITIAAWQSPDGLQHKLFAHRVAYEIANGPIPEGLDVLHACDNPPCVNPRHLFLGSQADNAMDMTRKGRVQRVRGAEKLSARFTDAQVLEIRRRYAAGMVSQSQLAREHGVPSVTVHNIVHRKTWTHI